MNTPSELLTAAADRVRDLAAAATPEQLVSETLFPASHWRRAYDQLGNRDEWPVIARWAAAHGVDPLHLPELMEALAGLGEQENSDERT